MSFAQEMQAHLQEFEQLKSDLEIERKFMTSVLFNYCLEIDLLPREQLFDLCSNDRLVFGTGIVGGKLSVNLI